jgi:hypothetical protein
MLFFNCLAPTDWQASTAARFAFVKEFPQRPRQGRLILLGRQQVVAAPIPAMMTLFPSQDAFHRG